MGADSILDSPPIGPVDDESVRHLVELGYVDPDETAAREAARRQELQAEFRQAIELNRQGRGQEAAALLVQLADEDFEWIAPHQLLAEIHYSAGQFSAVETELEWLANHGVDQPRVALIAAGIALMRRRLQPALDDLEFARFVEPNLLSVNTLTGSVLLRLGRLNDAEDAFHQAAEQDPKDARARDGLAAVCLAHGEYEDAADWALRALEQDIRLFHAHYHLGVALAHLHRPDEAIAALEAAARLDRHRAAPYFWLSRIADEQLKDPTRTVQYQNQAQEIIRCRRERRRTAVNSTSPQSSAARTSPN